MFKMRCGITNPYILDITVYKMHVSLCYFYIIRILICNIQLEENYIHIIPFRSHYGIGVDSASNRNEYQQYFLREKAAGA